MGFNTTVVVYNDALGAIENDPNFGKNLAAAVRSLPSLRNGKTHADVPAGNHCNAAMVVESHHADDTVVITVAANLGIVQANVGGWHHHTAEGAERALRAWANKLGFEVVKRPARD